MRDKTEQIVQAALDVFIEKGYSQATTQEIARKADVAEVTIYRKFQTKRNLFVSVIKPILMEQFDEKKLQEFKETEAFIKNILDNRIQALEARGDLFRMLIAESIMGHLEGELDFPNIMFNNLKKLLQHHFGDRLKPDQIIQLVRSITSIMFSYLMWPQERPYNSLPIEEKEALLDQYTSMLKTIWD